MMVPNRGKQGSRMHTDGAWGPRTPHRYTATLGMDPPLLALSGSEHSPRTSPRSPQPFPVSVLPGTHSNCFCFHPPNCPCQGCIKAAGDFLLPSQPRAEAPDTSHQTQVTPPSLKHSVHLAPIWEGTLS